MKPNLELHSGFKTSLLPFLLIVCAWPGAITSQAQSIYEPYLFTTFAGTAGTSGSADGTGSAAQFYIPIGVAADSAGNIYVADFGNHTIRKITPAGVVTTLAGLAGSQGSADGTGSAARFYLPEGVAVDSAGNVYVADTYNNTIRKITPAGVVSTLAGLAGSQGSADGTGSAARFDLPEGPAVDSAGNVYVADSSNSTIRKITPAGVVSTLAGLALSPGNADGTGSAARFNDPKGVAVDSAGNVYVADQKNFTIRKITPAGVVTTLAGLAGTSGSADGTGSAARFNDPKGVAVDSTGKVYVADSNNNTIRKITPAGVVTTLAGLAGTPGSADGTGSAARFNFPDGVAVDSTGKVYVADSNNNTIRAGVAPGGLANISTRAFVQTSDNVMIGGLIVTGSGQKKVILRAIGPSLSNFGIANALQDPVLELHDSTGALIASNDNWIDASNKQAISDSGLAPSNNLESAILTNLNPGSYTAIVRGVNNATGVALVEAYDLDQTAGSKFTNISTRAFAQTGDNVMIGGLIVTGSDSENVIVRVIGPSLTQYGIANALADPMLELHDSNGALIASNDNWKDTQQAQIQATGLAPSNDLESAIVATLTPAAYTAIVRGKNNTTGVALVEVFALK